VKGIIIIKLQTKMKASTILFALVASVSAIKVKDAESTKQLVALGEKLGLETTVDMFDGQSPEDVTNAIIGAALESGKSQSEIESAMSGQ
tara:strand:- start:226 stop:495 length:270 start_codon:yes stop_codon:yes gene_type:complete